MISSRKFGLNEMNNSWAIRLTTDLTSIWAGLRQSRKIRDLYFSIEMSNFEKETGKYFSGETTLTFITYAKTHAKPYKKIQKNPVSPLTTGNGAVTINNE